MGHATYPNATHTRFAHSLGVLAIMHRVTAAAEKNQLGFTREQQDDIRLAGLLHDIGHYPYSHLMEDVDRVVLTEERIAHGRSPRSVSPNAYPKHTELGKIIVTSQEDLLQALGGPRHAARIARLFTGEAKDKRLVKLVTSSLDMDRLDYLKRDSRSAGVPYGEIDINYLLNNLRVSKTGALGIEHKAVCAAEQFLFARYFMHRTVYYHKTTYGLEEALRQLVRRCRDQGGFGLPKDGTEVREKVRTRDELLSFTDAFLDEVARKALDDSDEALKSLAEAVVFRRPPKLLREVVALVSDDEPREKDSNDSSRFLQACCEKLPALAAEFKKDVRLFLITQLARPLRLEKRGPVISASDASSVNEKEEELIQVFLPNKDEPTSLVEVPHSLLYRSGRTNCLIARLYVIENNGLMVRRMKQKIWGW